MYLREVCTRHLPVVRQVVDAVRVGIISALLRDKPGVLHSVLYAHIQVTLFTHTGYTIPLFPAQLVIFQPPSCPGPFENTEKSF